MTTYEKTGPLYSVGESIKTFDKTKEQWINGEITEVGDESIQVQWNDLEDPTDYNKSDVSRTGDVFFESLHEKEYAQQLVNNLR